MVAEGARLITALPSETAQIPRKKRTRRPSRLTIGAVRSVARTAVHLKHFPHQLKMIGNRTAGIRATTGRDRARNGYYIGSPST
jgi:hypothetical protein